MNNLWQPDAASPALNDKNIKPIELAWNVRRFKRIYLTIER